MRKNAIVLSALFMLAGCASTRNVIDTVPDAVGTYAAASVFGGEVSYSPNPGAYVAEDINRTTRLGYSKAQRTTKDTISSAIMGLFDRNK